MATYSYNGTTWQPCPTTSDKNSFFHSAFGKRANEDEAFFDKQAKFKRMLWATFLTYFESTTMPSSLRDALKTSWSAIEKYRNASIEDPSSFEDYVSDIMGAGHDVVVGEIPILATLENIEIVVLSVDEPSPTVIRPDVKILGDYPNNAKGKEAVVLCLEGNTFSKLEPLPSDDLDQIINESDVEISDQLSSSLIKYDKGGSAGSKGVEYQNGILTVFLLNAFQKLKNWKLSTENKAAGKFDDVVLECRDGTVLLQAKHKEKKSKKITLEDLQSTNTKNDDFSLPKYFLAYEEIKNKFKIRNVIICTNIPIDEKVSKYVKLHVVNTDSILFYGNENLMFYTFNDNLLSCLKDAVRIYYEKNYQNKGIEKTVINEENLKQFLNHLQLYSSYPPEDDMMKVAEDILSRMKQFRLLQGQISSSELYNKVMDWYQQKKGFYLTETYAKTIFSEIRRDKHWQRLEEYNVLFQYHFDFQDSKRIYHITIEDGDLLQEIKVFRTLQNTRTNILYANPDDGVEGQKQTVEAFRLPLHTILVLVWSKTFEESLVNEVSNELRWILNKYQHKKVILVAEPNNTLPSLIGLSCGVLEGTVTFGDLLKHTQDELLKRNVIFQGTVTTLQDLLGAQATKDYQEAIDADVLEKLIRSEKVKVGAQPVYLGEDISRFYIDRSFERTVQKEMGNDVFGSNVPTNECMGEKCIYEVNEKLTLISDIAGMGKSTVLTKLAALVKENNPDLWVIRIELMDYTVVLKDSVRKNKDTITITELLDSKSDTRIKSKLEKYVFSMPGKVILMLDGIDEISPDYTRLVVKLLAQCQQESRFAKVFVTTRPHVTPELQVNLNAQFVLQPFTEQDQIDFLTKYWTYYLNLKNEETTKCKHYAETLIVKMSGWIASSTHTNNNFTAIPQQVRMLAEIFQEGNQLDQSADWEGCKEYLRTLGVEPKLPDSMSLTRLYEMFIEKKRELFIDKGNRTGNTAANQALLDQFDECLTHHRNLALELIAGETNCLWFSHYQPVSTNVETICKMGIVQKVDDQFHFVHRTFAEYFVAKSIVTELQLRNKNIEFQSYLIDEVLVTGRSNITRAFLNSFLEPIVDDLPSDIFHNYQSIHRVITTGQTQKFNVIHQLAEEGCVAILRLLFKCIHFQTIRNKLARVNQVYKMLVRENPGSIFSNVLEILQSLVRIGGVNIKDEVGKTPLIYAVQNNRLDMVKFLVSHGADIDRYNYRSPLYEAVEPGFLEISEFLVQQGADVKLRTGGDDYRVPYVAIIYRHSRIATLLFDKMLNEGLDPSDGIDLYTAAYLGRLDILEELVGRGADINCRVEKGETLIFAAARGGQLETINYLVSKGVDVNGKDDGNNTPLHIISSVASFVATANLLLRLGTKLDVRNSNRVTPLHIAAEFGVSDLVEAYIDAGTPVDIKTTDEKTPLYYAALTGNLDIVQCLLRRGADVNSKDVDGRTALHAAVFGHKVFVVRYLVGLGLDITAPDNFGRTLLHSAAYSGQLDVVKFLLDLGMKIDVEDSNGSTALYLAALWGHFDTVEYLVEHGADINARNQGGASPQLLFASRNHWRMIRYLAKHNVNLDIVDDNGCTPLHIAASRGYIDTVRYLLEQGVDVNIRNKEGYTALEMVPADCREEMIKLFETFNN